MISTFEELSEEVGGNSEFDPRQVSPSVWASVMWEKQSQKETHNLLRPFLKFQLSRAVSTMKTIYSPYSERKLHFSEFSDLLTFPALVKDTASHVLGFRQKVLSNPYVLLPTDVISSYHVFKSGGTRGIATPTFITNWDKEVESTTLGKLFSYMTFSSKDVVLNSYNPTHKGGQWISEAFTSIGAKVIPRRTTDTSHDVIDTIKRYNVTAIAAVQGPLSEGDVTKKGSGVDFLSLIESGQNVLEEKIETLFITGYSLIPEIIAWAEANNKKIATTLGSSEALPQASSTIPGKLCRYNNLHLINGPHYVEVVKQESGQLVPVKRGETGIVVYTTIARAGTIYIRYASGDSAKLVANAGECDCGIRTPIITDIRRIDIPEDTIAAGCCIG